MCDGWGKTYPDWEHPSRETMQGVIDRAGWTQRQAAEAVGVSPQNFRKWLQGKHKIPYSAWRLLLYETGVLNVAD